MRTLLLGLLILSSTSAFAESTTKADEPWVGATYQVSEEQMLSKQDRWDEHAQLELSNPWHYGRQDSDVIVGRERLDEHHD